MSMIMSRIESFKHNALLLIPSNVKVFLVVSRDMWEVSALYFLYNLRDEADHKAVQYGSFVNLLYALDWLCQFLLFHVPTLPYFFP